MDILQVKGLGRVDGTYEFDIVELLKVDGPQALNSREQHQIKLISGIRGGEISDAVFAGDAAVMVALAAVLLERNNKKPNQERLWDARMVYSTGDTRPDLDAYEEAINFHLATREEDEEESPPEDAPLEAWTLPNGGASSSSKSENPENDPSPTGHPVSPTPATFAQ